MEKNRYKQNKFFFSKKEEYQEYDNIIFFIFGCMIALLLIYLTFNGLIPAYRSYSLSCLDKTEESLNSEGYEIAGYYDKEECKIVVLAEDPKSRITTFRHEYCHYYWDKLGISKGCDKPFLFYIEEVSCYMFQ